MRAQTFVVLGKEGARNKEGARKELGTKFVVHGIKWLTSSSWVHLPVFNAFQCLPPCHASKDLINRSGQSPQGSYHLSVTLIHQLQSWRPSIGGGGYTILKSD